MKALVLTDYKTLTIQDIPVPSIQDNEVLVKVHACGICGSDVHGYDGSTGRRIPPIVMGHEASGVIVQTGKNVSGWKIGTRVTFDSTIYCMHCDYCRQGLYNLCDNRRVLGVSCTDYHQNGAFAEFVAIPEHILYALPDSVSFEQAALVEPVGVAFHAVNLVRHTLNESVVVLGAGMIGLLAIQSLRLAGVGKIIAVDVNEARLKTALEMGADHVILSDDQTPQKVKELLGQRGTDLAVDAVGISNTVATALSCTRKGGSLLLIGNLDPMISFGLQEAVTRQILVQGSCASNGEYGACLDMIARGAIHVDPFISKVAPLQEGPEWFEKLYNREGDLLKVILKP